MGDYAGDDWVQKLTRGGVRNRLMTVLYYLNDVPEEGWTIFPRVNGLPLPRTYADCKQGMRIAPRVGSAVVFYNLLPSGDLDIRSLHGACAPKNGSKWACNNWIWNEPSPV